MLSISEHSQQSLEMGTTAEDATAVAEIKVASQFMMKTAKLVASITWTTSASVEKPKPQEVTSGKGPAVDQDLQNAIAKLRGSKGTIALAKSEPSNGGDPGDA